MDVSEVKAIFRTDNQSCYTEKPYLKNNRKKKIFAAGPVDYP